MFTRCLRLPIPGTFIGFGGTGGGGGIGGGPPPPLLGPPGPLPGPPPLPLPLPRPLTGGGALPPELEDVPNGDDELDELAGADGIDELVGGKLAGAS